MARQGDHGARVPGHERQSVVFFDDVEDRDAADSLVRAILWIDQDVDEVEDDAWFDHQLVGLDVVRDDTVVGRVVRVEHFPAQDLLIVKAGENEVMVPFVSAIVPTVDVQAGRVIVTPPPDSSKSFLMLRTRSRRRPRTPKRPSER